MSKLKRQQYEELMRAMQVELNDMARWIKDTGQRVLIIFEGRDTAGKGGAIRAISDRLNPRMCRVVALAKPSEQEMTQMYVQRYVPHFPSGGEIVLFDRSWYNRAGVERVMGYCSDKEVKEFLQRTPKLERALVEEAGIEVQRLWVAGKRDEAIAHVPDEMVIEGNLLGDENMVKDRVRAFAKAGVTTLRVAPAGATLEERLETLGRTMDLVKAVA